MQYPEDPAIEGLVEEGPFPSFQPVALHENAMGKDLIVQPVISEWVERKPTDLPQMVHYEYTQPRNPKEQKRATEISKPLRDWEEQDTKEQQDRKTQGISLVERPLIEESDGPHPDSSSSNPSKLLQGRPDRPEA